MKQISVRHPGFEDLEKMQELQ